MILNKFIFLGIKLNYYQLINWQKTANKMSQEQLITNTSITLYAFHISQAGEDPRQLEIDARKFSYKLERRFPLNLNIITSLDFSSVDNTSRIDLTFFSQSTTLKIEELCQFNPQGFLLDNSINATLGQTFLIYAEPINALYKDYRRIADNCVLSFLKQNEVLLIPKYNSEGIIFGSPIFEYENRDINSPQTIHILVWLNSNPYTTQKVAETEFNNYLMNLLLYRSKIILAYRQSKIWVQAGEQIEDDIEKLSIQFQTLKNEKNTDKKLKYLNKLLDKIGINIFEYSHCLRELRERQNTMKLNGDNYGLLLKEIRELVIESDRLNLFQSFLSFMRRKYLIEVELDLEYLLAAKDLFEEIIATLRCTIEIENVKGDRTLQNIIIFLGTSLGIGLIISINYQLLYNKEIGMTIQWQPNLSLPFHPVIAGILWSLGIGLIFGIFILWIKPSFAHFWKFIRKR